MGKERVLCNSYIPIQYVGQAEKTPMKQVRSSEVIKHNSSSFIQKCVRVTQSFEKFTSTKRFSNSWRFVVVL